MTKLYFETMEENSFRILMVLNQFILILINYDLNYGKSFKS